MTRPFRPLPGEELGQLFQKFQCTAFRLETFQQYKVPTEEEEFSRFLSGEAEKESHPIVRPWITRVVERAAAAGKYMHRVHVAELPLSDYLRFEFAWGYRHSVSAGEDVKILPTPKGEWPEKLPKGYDYWLFDSSTLVQMHYGDDGAFHGAELVENAERIVEANYWRDLAAHAAAPYQEFARGFDSQFNPKPG